MTINDLKAFGGLDADIRAALLAQVRDLWTHGSTAIEGNTLTLGETKFVIEEGLTVSGKPLKDHQEVVGHARAIELLYRWLDEVSCSLFLSVACLAVGNATPAVRFFLTANK
jgi:Fic family protein